ncbi:MAG: VWA domain-containing protein [Labilithrix sp.]|nr:VWA domain-containing protein [Labilithrix sp.]
MSLVAPVLLAALGLLVPVLIAFLVRRQRQIVRVPSTAVWRLGARSVAKNRRIRDVRRLLALLACLFGVAALVVAAARPTGTRSDATVYVVDVSASMSGAPLREARAWLARDVAGRGPNARVAIVLAGAEPRVALSPSAPGPRVDEAIAAIAAEADVASMDEAVAIAEGLATATGARIVVLTDSAIESDVSREASKPEQRVFGRREGERDNLGVVGLFTRTPPDARDDEEREASVTLATSSSVARRARLVVTLAGRTVADRRVEVPARGEANERVLLRGAGRLVARVEPADGVRDALAIDDEASLEEAARRPPRVAFLHDEGDGAAAFFVEKALRAAGVTELTEVAQGDRAPSDAEIAVVLREGVRPPGVPAFLIGVEPKDLGLEARVVGRGETRLRSMAVEDPILRGVALDELTALRAKVAPAPDGARTLVDLDAGPTLIAGGAGTSAWVWLGIDPEASDLVLRVAFPVLVGNVLGHLGGASQIVAAKTAPRAEVTFESPEVITPLRAATEPRWRFPAGPATALAFAGAFLLALEAWLTFRKRWAT